MNVTPRAVVSFKNLPDAGLLAKTETIINAMTATPISRHPNLPLQWSHRQHCVWRCAEVAKTGTRQTAPEEPAAGCAGAIAHRPGGLLNFTAKGIGLFCLLRVLTSPARTRRLWLHKRPASVVNAKTRELASSVPRMDGGISFSHEYTLDPELAGEDARFTSTKANFTHGLDGQDLFVR